MARQSAIANEAILFQFGSPLATGLDKCFSDAIGYINAIDYTGIPEHKWVSHRYTMTHTYCKRVLFPAMQKVIEKSINLVITKIVDVRCFCGMFAVDISMDSVNDVVEIMSRQTGNNPGNTTLSSSARAMSEIWKNLDPETSKIDPNTFGKNGQRKIYCALYMDVDMAFLMTDNLPKDAVQPFTARELTAIYLHEIGHIVTFIAQAGNAYQQFSQMKKHLEKARNSKDLDEYCRVYKKELRGQLSELSRTKMINPKFLEAADSIVEYAEKLQLRKTDTDDYVSGTIEFMMNVLIDCVFFILFACIRTFIYLCLYGILRGLIFVITKKPGELGKSTDQSVSTNVYYHAERMADQYAARQGYGGDQASALLKLTQAVRIMNVAWSGGKIEAGSLRNSWIFANYLKVVSRIFEFLRLDMGAFSRDFFGPNNYEDDVERLHRLMTDTAAIFKSNLSPDVRTHYLGEIEKAKRALDEMKKPFYVKVSDLIWTYVLDVPMILKRLFQMDDMEEMEKLLRELDTIVNNELYVRAAEFKQLAGR